MIKRNKKNLIAFVHIEKAAGTTLNHILRANFLFKHFDVRPFLQESDKNFTISDLKKVLTINPLTMSISGHSVKPYLGLEKYYPNIKYITLLRDPVKRYLSNYIYWREDLKKDILFETYLDREDLFNYQTKKIAGSIDFNKAKTILINNFFMVGIVEEFNTFLALLKKKLEPLNFDSGYKIQNVSNPASKLKQQLPYLLEKYHDQIIDNNSEDIKLYDFVKNELYPKECKLYGDHLEKDVEHFNERFDLFRWYTHRSLDYFYRKLYINPITGLIRVINGLPFKGSY